MLPLPLQAAVVVPFDVTISTIVVVLPLLLEQAVAGNAFSSFRENNPINPPPSPSPVVVVVAVVVAVNGVVTGRSLSLIPTQVVVVVDTDVIPGADCDLVCADVDDTDVDCEVDVEALGNETTGGGQLKNCLQFWSTPEGTFAEAVVVAVAAGLVAAALPLPETPPAAVELEIVASIPRGDL